jgi:triacylglycerol lipase
MLNPEFDLDDAILCARASAAAYDAVRGQRLPFGHIVHVSECGQACVIDSLRGRILAFRGTSAIEEWLEDADAMLSLNPHGDGYIHKGFARHFARMWPFVKDQHRPRWICGHSLGGAMAVLAAVCLDEIHGLRSPVYTFGSPRVGNREFAASFMPVLYRVVNDIDPVPRVPLEFCYRHVGTPAFVADDQVTLGLTWFRSLRTWLGRVKDGLLATAALELEEHGIEEYIRALERVRDKERKVAA